MFALAKRFINMDLDQISDLLEPWVVGGYLIDRPRTPLHDLARSSHWWERRTAITATWPFIRDGDVDDTFALAAVLVHDPEHFVRTAVGGWVREAGKHDREQLRAFLDTYAATMPRITLRFAIEHLDRDERRHYRDRRPQPNT